MNAIILAAGQAKRLWPITKKLPKCLLQISNKAIIDHQIDALLSVGIEKIVIVVGFRAEKLMDHLTQTYPDVPFIFIKSRDYKKTSAAYSLWLAKEYLADTALYLNADVLFDRQIVKLIVDDPRGSITAYQRVPWDEEEVNVVLDKDDQVLEIGKQISPKLSHGEFIGITKLDPVFNKTLVSVLDEFIEKQELKKFAADSLNQTILRGETLFALDVTDYPAIEIDTIEDYTRAKDIVIPA